MIAVPRMVESADGIRLAVYESGDVAAPTVLAVHGYPDNHSVWDGVTELLSDRFHVVTYDVRGSGESDKPPHVVAYRMPRLVADLAAVLDAVSPDAPVHLLAHDWGAIQSWAAVADEQLVGRIASFTSISGPSLDQAAIWLRAGARHPRAALRQAAHSYYIGVFQLPRLPETMARTGLTDRVIRLAARGSRSSAAREVVPARSEADRVNGIALYRANMSRHLMRPRPTRIDVPVQVIAPEHDPYVTRELAFGAPRDWVHSLVTHTVAGGHWVVADRPDVIARLVTEFVSSSDDQSAVVDTQPRAGTFGGRFVVVTGGARGIGRETALEFARHGADVLVADIDDIAAKQTVDELRQLGGRAWAAHLDVSDEQQWTGFAETVRREHGVPDVVVNNAGIGMGGPFLGTSSEDWERILRVNLWSVIHGCRLFATQQVERGQGGHLVNIASAAAFSPSVVYPAYATTKAAVLMLTECLRAELDREGIGVTAVCPGFIDTDISRSTVHVGVDEATAQALREHQIASYGRRNYSPARVAKQIVRAVAANRPIAVITPEAKVFRGVSRFAPSLGRRIAKVDLNKL